MQVTNVYLKLQNRYYHYYFFQCTSYIYILMDIIAFNLIISEYLRWVSEMKDYKNLKSEIQVEITAVYFDLEVI